MSTPADDITNLAARFTGANLVQASNRISQWTDSIGAYHLTEATGANQPLYTASNALGNNKPSATFDNLNTRLRAGTSLAIRHVFIVGYYPATTFGGVRLLLQRNPGGASHHIFRSLSDATWRTGDQVAGSHYTNGTASTTAITAANTPHIWEFQCTASESGTWHLGDDVTASGRQFTGTVFEIRLYSALKSGTARQGILAQLVSDYAIPNVTI